MDRDVFEETALPVGIGVVLTAALLTLSIVL
jgi:hypothetical protein